MNKSKVFLALKIVAVSIAGIVLALALTYYNFIVPEENFSGVLLHTMAPNFKLSVYDGEGLNKEYSLEDSRGKVVILNFWATTCNPCIHELPYFNALKKKYGDEVEVVAIHGTFVTEDVQAFINNPSKHDDLDWKTYEGVIFAQDVAAVEYDEQILTAFKAFGGKDAYPVTAIINAEGVFARVIHGSITYKKLEDEYIKVKKAH